MKLSREAIQRMVGDRVGGSGAGGAGISGNQVEQMLAGYARQEWVDSNYVSIEFFGRLFQAYNGNTAVNPNDTTATIDNVKAMFGFWTEQYLSARGRGAGGGGGGGTGNVTWDELAGTAVSPHKVDISYLTGAISTLTGGTSELANKRYAVQLNDNNQLFVDVPWTDTIYSFSNADATLAWSTRTKIATVGGTDIYVTMPANPNTDHYDWDDITNKPATATRWPAFSEVTGSASASQVPNIENLTNFSSRVYDATVARTANTVLAGPTSGNAAAATFRALVAADIPSLAISKISGLQTALDSKLDIAFFSSMFKAYAGTTEVAPNGGDTSTIDNIKAMFGFWTKQYLSARGRGAGGGGGGGIGNVTWDELAGTAATGRKVDISYLADAISTLTGYTTSGRNYAVEVNASNQLYVNVPWTDTTYGADNGVGLSGTTFYNSGVRATSINGNYLRVNTNGTNADLTIPYATNAGTALVGNKLNAMATISSQNTTNYPWRLIAKSAEITTNYQDTEAVIVLRQYAVGGKTGTIKIAFRVNEIATTASGVAAVWLDRFGFAVDDVKIAVYWVANKSYADVFLKATAWNRMELHVIGNRNWSFVSSSEGTDGANPVNAYASIEAAATALHGRAYTSIVSAQDGGIVNYANTAGSAGTANSATTAGSATKATQDGDGNTISSTYLKLVGGTMANANLVTNLNADLLDGTHKSDLFTVFTNILSGDDANKTSITIGSTNKKLVINYATNANSAAKLTTVSKTAWGRTYWTDNGVPDSISGNMSSVGDISFSASGKKIGGFLYFDTTNNRLGVDTSSPSYKLHVAGSGYFSDNLTFANNKGIYMKDSDGEVNNVLYLSSNNQLILGSETANEGYNTYLRGGAVHLQYGGSNTGLMLNSSGNVGIGTTSPSYKLSVSGDIVATGCLTGRVTSASDIHAKNISSTVLPLSLVEIANAPTIRFKWKQGDDQADHVGSIAQYWQSVMPEVIWENKEGMLTLEYGTAALISSITIAREVAALKQRIKELERKLKN